MENFQITQKSAGIKNLSYNLLSLIVWPNKAFQVKKYIQYMLFNLQGILIVVFLAKVNKKTI